MSVDVSGFSLVIPLYTLMRGLGWTDTYAALILPEPSSAVLVAMVPFLFLQRYYIRVVATQADR